MRLLLLLLVSALPASARLGETRDECDKRYGIPVKTLEGGGIVYAKAGLHIVATFWNSKVSHIMVCKVERDALNTPKELSQNEIEILLKANDGGSEWKKSEALAFMRSQWERADGKAVALYKQTDNYLTIIDTAYASHLDEEKEKKEAKVLDGF
ncbi:MAG: hypothetical protein EOP83_02325 [Verrucomicrobiaceae bacterium]|nr:MAG: hypothetical protein EOP83_02325 [Verrucomicrobiaceae bacterium]